MTNRPAHDREADFELEENLAREKCFGVETESVDEEDFGAVALLGNDFMVSMR